jgi:predicted transcriptional regulator
MRKMLLSFKPEVYKKIKSGQKIFEHRRNFPDEPIMAYMYVSAPVKAITGIVYLGKRHLLSDWKEEFKDDENAVARIEKYQESYRYAMEIDVFQETTEISLENLRRDVPGFVAPQMYIYLDGTRLLEYVEARLVEKSINIKHTFDIIDLEEICVN